MLGKLRAALGRWSGVVALGAVVALGGALLVGAPAQADTATVPGENAPRPVDTLPSVVYAGTGSPIGDNTTLMMYQFMRSPDFWKAVAATQNGNASHAQKAVVKKGTDTYAVPAVKPKKLTKVLSGASATFDLFNGLQEGLSIGATVSRAFGFKDDEVCSQDNDALTAIAGFLDSVDCSAWQSSLPQGDQNADATPGFDLSAPYCSSPGNCVSSGGAVTRGGNVHTTGLTIDLCLSVTGSPVADLWYIADLAGPLLASGTVVKLSGTSGCSGGPYARMDSYAAGSTPESLGYSYTPLCLGPASGVRVSTAAKTCTASGGATVQQLTPRDVNPTRHWDCELQTTDGQLFTLASAPFQESDAQYPSPSCPPVPNGLTASHETVKETGGPAPITVAESDTTPEYQAAQAAYPDCSTGTCLLDLRSTSTNASCFQTPGPCADWYSDPNKASDYSCSYGTHAVDLSECTVYAPTFRPGSVGTSTEYGNPETGQQAQSAPDTDTSTSNVLTKLFVPSSAVQAEVQSKIGAAWDSSAPGVLIQTVPKLALPAFDASGCEGPELSLTVDFWRDMTAIPYAGPVFASIPAVSYDGHPLSACDDPAKTVAFWARLLSGCALIWLGSVAVFRQIGSIVGARGLGGAS